MKMVDMRMEISSWIYKICGMEIYIFQCMKTSSLFSSKKLALKRWEFPTIGTIWLFNMAMENPPIFNRLTIYFYGSFSMAMLVITRGYIQKKSLVSWDDSPLEKTMAHTLW